MRCDSIGDDDHNYKKYYANDETQLKKKFFFSFTFQYCNMVSLNKQSRLGSPSNHGGL